MGHGGSIHSTTMGMVTAKEMQFNIVDTNISPKPKKASIVTTMPTPRRKMEKYKKLIRYKCFIRVSIDSSGTFLLVLLLLLHRLRYMLMMR